MNIDLLKQKFRSMGAKLVIEDHREAQRAGSPASGYRIDLAGDCFRIDRYDPDIQLQVIDLDRSDRHLVLMAKHDVHRVEKHLCGHDERHWFVAALPERTGARADRLRQGISTVRDAKEALKPAAVVEAQRKRDLKRKHRNRRKNKAFLRQGEWFFVPQRNFRRPKNAHVLRNEPISRGRGSKPHLVQQLVRFGGEKVYTCFKYPEGVTEAEYQAICQEQEKAPRWNWAVRVRNPEVYACGRVSHPDHATIQLDGWHRVLMNTEAQADHAERVVFLD